ncbi:TolB family protein [Caldalkalibacillus mannanilyticus]|uniref:TolB family protein n=1 Tax=Caldalkalibacillus mannanilyticus TaxID=1418 RepID=UPI00068726E9|nr:hypothetical protein [Caldalkalibacillus mannanilyticus]
MHTQDFSSSSAPLENMGCLAYTLKKGLHFDIWLYHPLTGYNRPLVSQLATESSVPYWSSKNDQIAFVGHQNIVYVVEISSGKIRRIDQVSPSTLLSWSPDDTKLAYTKQDHIIIYDLFQHTSLAYPQQGATDVQWFPAGNRLLFQGIDEQGNSQVYVLNLETHQKEALTNVTDMPHHHLRLSSDGRFFLFTSPGVSISIIYTQEINTGNRYELEGGPLGKNYSPAWSPHSQSIAYSATDMTEQGVYYSLIQSDTHLGGEKRNHAIANCFSTQVAWTADGRITYLAGCSQDSFPSQIWLIDRNKPIPTLLVNQGQVTAHQWSGSTQRNVVTYERYNHPQYKVSFVYPSHWKQVSPDRFEGKEVYSSKCPLIRSIYRRRLSYRSDSSPTTLRHRSTDHSY